MPSLQDAMKSAGLATEDQISKIERDKQKKAEADRRRNEKKLEQKAKRRAQEFERQGFNTPHPAFLAAAIFARRGMIEEYIIRAEKEMGELDPDVREKLKEMSPVDALVLLGSTLTLFSMMREASDLRDDSKPQENFDKARENALKPLKAAIFPKNG